MTHPKDPIEPNGWNESAAAWLTEMGNSGDYGREFVLDTPMLARLSGRGFATALDVGCGEGRFCRMMKARGIRTTGIDPTQVFIDHARRLDSRGDYRLASAENMDVEADSFDLVVSYLSLIDIPDLATAMRNVVRALKPGGSFLLANLTSFNTASPSGWKRDGDGQRRFYMDNYLEERANWATWRGIRIRNWHRPLSTYMTLFLQLGLELRHFDEPKPTGGDPQRDAHYRRVPYFHIMEWQKRL